MVTNTILVLGLTLVAYLKYRGLLIALDIIMLRPP